MTAGREFDDFQREVGEWQARTFPESTRGTVAAHLGREVEELRESGDPEEIADCLLLLIAYAGKAGVSLMDLARRKFEVCKARKWGEPDAQGVREHVRDGCGATLREMLRSLRSNGWAVAVHNDYRLDGETFTFWLFTHGDLGVFIKGEGRTDEEAVRKAIAYMPAGVRLRGDGG